ncbi:MAG: SDR family oxidoreductase [Proteobacteria bacterium]|nr:SDR family oxidoreductase [Pseudomonadota bacterium]MBU1741079.1 SDR family oxidoreductase [Pseudomonadota bacterium]
MLTPHPPRVLVAGATGYLGGFVTRELKSRGHFVRALGRSPEKSSHLQDQVDEVVVGQVTTPTSLANVCQGIDVVFSSIGITRQKDGLTFKDVDYQGNLNLLEEAQRAGVKKFVYVSVLGGLHLRHLDIVAAHEDFVDELVASGVNYAAIRPTGYFSDMTEFFGMARRGRVWLVGPGQNRVNPIHGADLAVVCADAVTGEDREIDVGGPDVFTYRQIAELAFQSLDRPVKIVSIPARLARFFVAVTRVFNRHRGELLAFMVTAATSDIVAPSYGTHTLQAYFRECAQPGAAATGRF